MVSKKKKDGKPKKLKAGADSDSFKPEGSELNTEETVPAAPSGETCTSTDSAKVRRRRGVVGMEKVLMKKAKGQKTDVKYNDKGTPSRDDRTTLQSYIGMVVRKTVPINILDWRDVSKEDKAMVWKDITDTFNVAPESEKDLMISAGAKWRQFKTELFTKHVLSYLGKKKKLRKPPKMYDFVGLRAWKEFVKLRSTPQWLELHEKQSGRVKNRKCHHRTSRKGYIGLEEDLRQSWPEGEVIDRAVLWKKARLLPDGKMDEEAAVVATKIDELLELKRKGELEISGTNDVLTQALKTPEHRGRVRAVGGNVPPSRNFNLPKQARVRVTKAELMARDRERQQELEETKKSLFEHAAKTEETFLKKIAELEARIAGRLAEDDQQTPVSDKCSEAVLTRKNFNLDAMEDCYEEDDLDDCEPVDPPSPNKENTCCELAVDEITNIVAFGTLITEESMNKMIHGVPLQDGCVRVSVDGALKGDALLPIPVKNAMELVNEAVGSHVQWPANLVIFTSDTSKRALKPTGKKKSNLKPEVEMHPMVPKRCKLLYKHAKTVMEPSGVALSTVLNEKIFGVEKQLYVLPENVTDLLEMNWIGQGVITAYMAYLHEMISEREDELDLYGFIDPSRTFEAEKSKTFKSYLVKRLKDGNADRIMFMPYNTGKHWILTIIWENEIYILDSMPRPSYTKWEKIVSDAVKMFNAETGRGNKVPAVKRLAGVPKQPGGYECGYYVMRYIRDIINDDTLGFAEKWAARIQRAYTEEELDEVRVEVGDFFSGLI